MRPALTVRFWGVRGSVPSPGARTARYGGNTPCVEVRAGVPQAAGGACVILDAGTGIRALGEALEADARATGAPVDATICVTHAHWDHVQGLPFFAPLYMPGARVTAVASPAYLPAVEHAVRGQMRPPVFPVAWDELPADRGFRALPDDGAPLERAGISITAIDARHPGGAAGFRVAPADGGAAVVYLPDNEIAESSDDGAWRDVLLASVRDAGLLIHDATYLPEELPTRGGWGHSSWDEAVRLAADAGVRRLALFHHFAERSDAAVDAVVERARAAAAGSGLTVLAASEGLVLHV